MIAETRVQLVLADRGTVDQHSGCVNLLNAGWSWSKPAPGTGVAFVIAAIVEVPWDRCNVDLPFQLELVTDDGQIVQDPSGLPIVVAQVLRVSPRAGAPAGASGVGTILVEFPAPGLALEPRNYYHWRAQVDGLRDPQWQATFWVDADPMP